MDERAVNGAAIQAINDLQLDCEIKDVCKSPDGDEWCIQFSGKYGQFCDGFKNQFEKESSTEVMREKIKGYLIKQVNKISRTTGRRRRPAVVDAPENREPESGILSAPLKIIQDLFDNAVSIAGGVASQASAAAETARDVVSDVASNIPPVTITVGSTARKVEKRPAATAARKAVKATKATSAKAKKAAKQITRRAGKQAKKAAGAAKKAAGRARKVSGKKAKKSKRRQG
jgi:hypothetical protein